MTPHFPFRARFAGGGTGGGPICGMPSESAYFTINSVITSLRSRPAKPQAELNRWRSLWATKAWKAALSFRFGTPLFSLTPNDLSIDLSGIHDYHDTHALT